MLTATGDGDVEILAAIPQANGLYGEYYDTTPTPSSPPTVTQIDPKIEFNWLEGNIGPLSVSDSVSIRWTGFIR